MLSGAVVGGRFEVERAVGAGGMGTVYAALDRQTGTRVALKVLHGVGSAVEQARFVREARALALLRHAAIVRYVEHGVLDGEQLWLAMEWLEGEDLGFLLERGALRPADAIAVVRRIADALAAVHARGLVHRDIKPSNVFVPNGDLERAMLIDFGIARSMAQETVLTQAGGLIGTPGYMAPEQARGVRAVDPRIDVFALGCVLYECLTGERAWRGANVVAVLASILLDAAPRLRERRPELPVELEDFVSRMMARDPEARPADGAAVVAGLEAFDSLPTPSSHPRVSARPPVARAITAAEQRLVTIVLVGGAESGESIDTDVTLAVGAETFAQRIAKQFGGRADPFVRGLTLVSFSGGVATDVAIRAARCAIAIRAHEPLPMVIATGRAELDRAGLAGEVVSRAMARFAAGAIAPGRIDVDALSAGLLDAQFELVARDGATFDLQEARAESSFRENRRVLGRVVPCIGRDRELADLEATLAQCTEEPVARAVLVTAAAGVGKSRVAAEFAARAARLEEASRPVLLSARSDPSRAGAMYGLVSQLVGCAADVSQGDPAEARQARVLRRCEDLLAGDVALRTAVFLSELVGAPFDAARHPALAPARATPSVLAEELADAWLTLLEGLCARSTVVLSIEDLHWADPPSVRLLDAALARLAERPLMVVALARPEVHDVFPSLWQQRDVHELRLAKLTRRAAEALVRAMMGPEARPERVAKIVEQAEGNAFHLEESVRAVLRAGDSDELLPETALALAQARLERLAPDDRRLLRAASTFGETAWTGALGALLQFAPELVSERVETLVAHEFLTVRAGSRFAGETEVAFRHALLRDAAYATFVDRDRALAHRLAGHWLESVGESDAGVIALHLQRGDSPGEAFPWFVRAVRQAIASEDFRTAERQIDHAHAALAAGALTVDPTVMATFGVLEATVLQAHGRLAEAAAKCRTVLDTPMLDDDLRHEALALYVDALNHQGLGQAAVDAIAPIAVSIEAGGASIAALRAFVVGVFHAVQGVASASAQELLRRTRAIIEAQAGEDALVALYLAQTDSFRALVAGALPYEIADPMERAAASYEKLGMSRRAAQTRAIVGACFAVSGLARESADLLSALLAQKRSRSMGIYAGMHLGLAQGRLGDVARARATLDDVAEQLVVTPSPRSLATALTYRAMVELESGASADAVPWARRGSELGDIPAATRAFARAVLSRALVASGEVAEGLEHARAARDVLDAGGVDEGEMQILLALAEALSAAGAREEARDVIELARSRLLTAAARVPDEAIRARILGDVPEHRAILALALACGLPASGG
jgi:tetratricopeptide (TPR) repeat protein